MNKTSQPALSSLLFIPHPSSLIPYPVWQISAGYLSELLLPAALALAVVLSAGVLADARRRFSPGATIIWTLFALAAPPVTLPLYLAARILSPARRDDDPAPAQATEQTDDVPSDTQATPREGGDASAEAEESGAPSPRSERLRGLVLPLAYASLLLAALAVYFYADRRSADAHFARARSADLFGRRERAIREYRAALALEEDAHTRKLLAKELYAEGRLEEALAEFRAAGERGEPDDLLDFYAASTLDALGRADEAAPLYVKTLRGPACEGEAARAACATARSRLQAMGRAAPP